MSRREDLEQSIRESYEIINEYQAVIRTSERAEEKLRARRVIQAQRALIEGYQAELDALAGHAEPAKVVQPESPPPEPGIEPPYGTMPPDSRLYIERRADDECWRLLGQGRATTIHVQAPRQMGKSSLMRRMAYRVKQAVGLDTAF